MSVRLKWQNLCFVPNYSFSFIENIRKKTSMLKKYIPVYSKLQELKNEVRLVTSYSSDSVYRLKYDSMTYEYISPSIIKLLGFTPDEMKKINFRSLILETKIISNGIQAVHSFKELEEKRKSGNVSKWQADYLMRTKDGRKIWVTDVSFPWFDDSGKVIGSIGSLRDITDRINAEKKVRDELVRLANTDPLTGLSNRRTFFDAVENELKRIKRSYSDFSILLIDIDHFKKINDTYGHSTGDKILKELGSIMKGGLRETDLVARVGGEEFGIFLPDTPEEGAFWVADRICTNIAKHNFFVKDSQLPISCTVSIGISSTEDKHEISATELYKQADTRLYIAKNTGRNQVSMDEIMHVH